MDRFLIFFQRYVFTKEYLLMDLEIELLDTLEAIRPHKQPKLHSYRQASEACDKILAAEDNPGRDNIVDVIGFYCYRNRPDYEPETKKPETKAASVDVDKKDEED
jgi:hypothetical protein